MDYFIHIADPGFPEAPWPEKRRLGPFTLADANEQAASDIAAGHYASAEIYSAIDSEGLRDAHVTGFSEAIDLFDAVAVGARAQEIRDSRLRSHALAVVEASEKLEGSVVGALIKAGVLSVTDEERAKLAEVGLL